MSCFKAPNDYAAACFRQYGMTTDRFTGRYAAMYKPYHLIGLELSISVLNAALQRRADRTPPAPGAATSRRSPSAPSSAGEMLDGEGGFTVYGKLIPTERSLAENALPIGLAHGVTLNRDVPAGGIVTQADVALDLSVPAVRVRREMEAEAKTPGSLAA
jgi:predicted homoserine dehydrogenase-like protein